MSNSISTSHADSMRHPSSSFLGCIIHRLQNMLRVALAFYRKSLTFLFYWIWQITHIYVYKLSENKASQKSRGSSCSQSRWPFKGSTVYPNFQLDVVWALVWPLHQEKVSVPRRAVRLKRRLLEKQQSLLSHSRLHAGLQHGHVMGRFLNELLPGISRI